MSLRDFRKAQNAAGDNDNEKVINPFANSPSSSNTDNKSEEKLSFENPFMNDNEDEIISSDEKETKELQSDDNDENSETIAKSEENTSRKDLKNKGKKQKKVKEKKEKRPKAKGEKVKKEKGEKKDIDLKQLFSKKDKDSGIPLTNNFLIDLTPQSHKDVIAIRRSKKTWTYTVSFVLIACIMAAAGFWAMKFQTKTNLDAEISNQEQIDIKISNYAEINQTLESEKESVRLLNQAAGAEIDWEKLIKNIESALPSGTEITSLGVTNGGGSEDDVSSAIIMSLSSKETIGYSDTLKAVQGIGGVNSVEIGGLSASGDNAYTYKMAFTYDKSILTENYELEK